MSTQLVVRCPIMNHSKRFLFPKWVESHYLGHFYKSKTLRNCFLDFAMAFRAHELFKSEAVSMPGSWYPDERFQRIYLVKRGMPQPKNYQAGEMSRCHCWGLQGGRKIWKKCWLGHPGIAGRMVLNVWLNLCWQTGTYANFELYIVGWNPAPYQFGRYFIIFWVRTEYILCRDASYIRYIQDMVFYAIIVTASCIPGGRMYSNHRGKGQNFLCFQEAVMQAVHVLNTVTVPMGLQCPGLIVISPESTQDECLWCFLCNSHVFFFSLFIVGRMVGKANHCFTTSMGYTFCSMCLHCPSIVWVEVKKVKLSAFRNIFVSILTLMS